MNPALEKAFGTNAAVFSAPITVANLPHGIIPDESSRAQRGKSRRMIIASQVQRRINRFRKRHAATRTRSFGSAKCAKNQRKNIGRKVKETASHGYDGAAESAAKERIASTTSERPSPLAKTPGAFFGSNSNEMLKETIYIEKEKSSSHANSH
jgi:hypothetical protein